MQKIAQRSLTWSTHSQKSAHSAQRTAHSAQRTAHSVSDNSTQKRDSAIIAQSIFYAHINFRRKFSHNLFGVKPLSLLLFAALALLACDPPKSSSPPGPRIERKADGSTITTKPTKDGGTLAVHKDKDGKETKRVVTMPRFTLTQKTDKTYALAVADGVTSIERGEFASSSEKNRDGSIATALDTRLKRSLLGAKPEEAITTITLPSTLTSIEDYAFFRHLSVKGVLTIPAKVQSIGKKAFRSVGVDEAGVSLTFADGSQLTTIGDNAFEGSHLSSFAPLPEQLETIGRRAFWTGKPLTVQNTSSLIIPAKVKTIGDAAFLDQKFTGSATLTIRSLHLKNTASTTPLGRQLFVIDSSDPPPFTTIKLPKAVYDSYKKEELENRFGRGVTYQDLDGNNH